jgi:cell division protein FtsQ
VRLPEVEPAKAIAQLAKIEREHGLLDKDVITIDLRLPDRLVVRTAPGTMPVVPAADGENT